MCSGPNHRVPQSGAKQLCKARSLAAPLAQNLRDILHATAAASGRIRWEVSMKKTIHLIAAIACATLASFTPAGAQDYPNKPIRLIVPFLAGAGTDLSARVFADFLSPRL